MVIWLIFYYKVLILISYSLAVRGKILLYPSTMDALCLLTRKNTKKSVIFLSFFKILYVFLEIVLLLLTDFLLKFDFDGDYQIVQCRAMSHFIFFSTFLIPGSSNHLQLIMNPKRLWMHERHHKNHISPPSIPSNSALGSINAKSRSERFYPLKTCFLRIDPEQLFRWADLMRSLASEPFLETIAS